MHDCRYVLQNDYLLRTDFFFLNPVFTNLPVVLYGCETWSLMLREGQRLKTFENRVLRRIFRPKRDEVTGEWRKLHNEELNDLYPHPIFSGDKIEKNEMGGAWARMERLEVYTGFWWGNVRERDHFEDPDIDGRIILKWIFRKWNVRAWTGSIWLRIGTGGGNL